MCLFSTRLFWYEAIVYKELIIHFMPIDHFTVPCVILKGSQAFPSKRGWSWGILLIYCFFFRVSTVDQTAVSGSDFQKITNRLLTFSPGQSNLNFDYDTMTEDNVTESNETFSMTMSTTDGASIPMDTTTITIINDDKGLSNNMSIRMLKYAFCNNFSRGSFLFKVVLSPVN
jgi:hypothetical protein